MFILLRVEACSQISEVALHINNHIKQHDNSIRMLSIQKSLGGSLAPNLITPGRVFIKEGPLRKVRDTIVFYCVVECSGLVA